MAAPTDSKRDVGYSTSVHLGSRTRRVLATETETSDVESRVRQGKRKRAVIGF